MSSWNAMTYEGKDTILRVVRNEAEQFFEHGGQRRGLGGADGRRALAGPRPRGPPRRHDGGVLRGFDAARGGRRCPRRTAARDGGAGGQEAHGIRAPPRELVERLRGRLRQDEAILEALDRGGLDRPDGPALLHGSAAGVLLPGFQLMDYGVHSWDIRQGTGRAARARQATSADLLVPFMFVLWK